MRKILGSRLIDQKLYWQTKSTASKYKLRYRSRKFAIKNNLKSELANGAALYGTLKSTLSALITAIIIATCLHYLDRLAAPKLALSGWKIPNESDYVTFLSAVAGIGGVFIGLYYAALTSVGSAIYAKVPNNIRNLLIKERSGNVYMRFLSTLTLLCILLIACRICGLPAMISAVPIIALFSGAGIVAFVKLGRTAFNLFDPTALSHHIFEDLNKAILEAMAGGPHWTDPSFQRHAHVSASQSIETLRLLLDITTKETHQNGRPLLQLSCEIVEFLSIYEICKLKIPSDSHWYPQQFKHRDWYSTPGHSLMIAHKTGTALQPEMTKSPSWIELQLHMDLLRILSINLAQGKHLEVSKLISYLDRYIGVLTYNGNLDKAYDLADRISTTITNTFKTLTPESHHLSELEKLSIIESIATLPITIALVLTKHAERINIKKLTNTLTQIDWNSKESIYSSELPTYLLPQGEWLLNRLSTEFMAEGRIVSPAWYQKDIINLALTKTLADQISSFPSRSIAFFTTLTASFAGQEHRWFKACTQSREHEFWHKAERTHNALIESWNLSKDSRSLSDLPWASIQESTIDTSITNRKRDLAESIAAQTINLLNETPDDFPDYPGQFLFITGESFFDALCKNDDVFSHSNFQAYLLGSIARFEKLKPGAGVTVGLEDGFRIATTSLLDLIELSGYAFLLSEFHQNKSLWQPIKEIWTNLANGNNGDTIKRYLALVIQLNSNGFGLPLRGELRFEWARTIWNLFKELPIRASTKSYGIGTEYLFEHTSPLIRSLDVTNYGRLPSGFNLFIVNFYIEIIKPEEFELNWEQESLLKKGLDKNQ